jgi:hypothetical protein
MSNFLSVIQGGYFLLTGVWALVSIDTFQKVTGPKTDLWLVKTVGAIVAVIGFVLLFSVWHGEVSGSTVVLAVGSAAALAAIDINYSLKGTISKIYLLDAAAEIVLIMLWLLTTNRS